MHREAASRRVDGGAYACQDLFPLGRRELGVAAGGGQEVQPFVPRVGPFPVEAPLLRVAEPARCPYPVGGPGAQRRVPLHGRLRRLAGGKRVGHHPAVHLGEGFRQFGRRLARVPEDDQAASGPQRLRRLGRSGDRVHPVPGLPGDDGVELPARRFPGFERRRLGLESAAARDLDHPRVDVDAQHLAAGCLELSGHDAGAAADVEDVGDWARGDDPVHQGLWVGGPRPVVAFGVRAERFRYLSEFMRL